MRTQAPSLSIKKAKARTGPHLSGWGPVLAFGNICLFSGAAAAGSIRTNGNLTTPGFVCGNIQLLPTAVQASHHLIFHRGVQAEFHSCQGCSPPQSGGRLSSFGHIEQGRQGNKRRAEAAPCHGFRPGAQAPARQQPGAVQIHANQSNVGENLGSSLVCVPYAGPG